VALVSATGVGVDWLGRQSIDCGGLYLCAVYSVGEGIAGGPVAVKTRGSMCIPLVGTKEAKNTKRFCAVATGFLALSSFASAMGAGFEGRPEGFLLGSALAPYIFTRLVVAVLSIYRRFRSHQSVRCSVVLVCGVVFLIVGCSYIAETFPPWLASLKSTGVQWGPVAGALASTAFTQALVHLLRVWRRRSSGKQRNPVETKNGWLRRLTPDWVQPEVPGMTDISTKEASQQRMPRSRTKDQGQIDVANRRTAEANAALSAARGILAARPEKGFEHLWTAYAEPFEENKPAELETAPLLPPPEQPSAMTKPNPKDAIYDPGYNASVIDAFIPSRWRKRQTEAAERFESDVAEWKRNLEEIRAYADSLVQWRHANRATKSLSTSRVLAHDVAVREWDLRKAEHNLEQYRKVERSLHLVEQGDAGAVAAYFRAGLRDSEYPLFFPREFELTYNPASRRLIVDFTMLSPSDLPTLREVVWDKKKKRYSEIHIGSDETDALYRDVLCQTCLRTLHEAIAYDTYGLLDAVGFNGWVHLNTTADSGEETACIVAVCADSMDIRALDLTVADPESCFEDLGGVISPDPASRVGVEPIRATSGS